MKASKLGIILLSTTILISCKQDSSSLKSSKDKQLTHIEVSKSQEEAIPPPPRMTPYVATDIQNDANISDVDIAELQSNKMVVCEDSEPVFCYIGPSNSEYDNSNNEGYSSPRM